MRAVVRAASLFLVGLLAGCGGGQVYVVPDSDAARDWLGLRAGAVWEYAFSDRIEEDVDGVTRATTSEGAYREKVVSISVVDGQTVVEVLREPISTGEESGGWSVGRRAGPIFYVIGDNAVARPVADYGTQLDGRAVYVQHGALKTKAADRTWLGYVLPFRTGTFWHANPWARAAAAPTWVGIRQVHRERADFETPAGRFDRCYEIETPANTRSTTVSVCEGVGMVRRVTRRRVGNPRFVIEETLSRFEPGP